MILYPAIDLLDGRCARLRQGQFDEKTVYGEPAAQLKAFADAGASCIHMVDLDGAKDPAKRQTKLISTLLKATRLKVQIGGGVRSLDDVRELIDMGAERVVLGSVLAREPEVGAHFFETFGDKLTAAFDVRVEGGDAIVAVSGWQRSAGALETLIESYRPLGLSRVLCTDIAKDGMLGGSNLALYRRLVKDYPGIQIQASGGVGTLDDLSALKDIPVHSAVVGKAFYEKRFTLKEALARC
jgi:phosphoribosylformimino-5-aminoimidazole carboxamide ribotide isomerase